MKSILFAAILLGFSSQFSCDVSSPGPIVESPEPIDSIPFLIGQASGTLDNNVIDEASGMIASRTNPGHFWTHNDSGDSTRLFLINDKANWVGNVRLAGAKNVDWEDITYFGDNQIVVADIGDNLAVRPSVDLYWLQDIPVDFGKTKDIPVENKLTVVYKEGPRDAETLIYDPVSSDLYIVTKREPAVHVYQISKAMMELDTVILEKQSTLPLTQIVAGDISADGSEILLKNYDFIYYFHRKPGQSVIDALQQIPVKLPYTREPQGESICFGIDGKAFYTVSEETAFKIKPVLYCYVRK